MKCLLNPAFILQDFCAAGDVLSNLLSCLYYKQNLLIYKLLNKISKQIKIEKDTERI